MTSYTDSSNIDRQTIEEEDRSEPVSDLVSRVSKKVEEQQPQIEQARELNPSVDRFTEAQDAFNEDQQVRKQREEAYNKAFIDPIIQSGYAAPMLPFDEFERRFADGNGNIKTNPLDWNLLGFTSQNKSSDATRNLYDAGFERFGNIEPTSASADKESRQNFASPRISNNFTGINALGTQGSRSANLNDVPGLDRILDVDRNLIDDGRSEDSREAMFMTGEQYLRYINDFGIPGRPVRQIDPDEIYSKQDEMENYGFIPYLATQEGFDRFHDVASENAVSNLFNDIANARRLATDYTINYGDQSFSGKDLQRNSSVWSKNLKNEMENPDPNKQVFDRSQASEFAVPHKAVYSIRTQDGQSATHEGEPTKQQFSDGHIEYTWSDGTNWSFDDMADLQASAGVSYQPTTDDDELASMWYELTPFELDDGTKIRADKAQQMLADVYNNMDEYANYGPGNIAKPVVESPLEGLAPWLSDIFTGSAPLFYSPVAGAQAAAGAMNAYQGMKPGYDDYVGGTYSMVSQDPREDQRILSTLGNAALPLTERLWGPIGGTVLGGVTKRIPGVRDVGERISHAKPWQRYLAGIGGEAAEEIPGNIVEEFMNGSGFDWYANPIFDENSNPRYDQQGRQMYDPNTPIGQRVGNFLADAPMAMLGGAAMGGILGTTSIPKYRNEYAEYQKNGASPKIEEGYSENITTPLTEREIREYNR